MLPTDAEAAKFWLSWVRFGQSVAVFLVAVGVVLEFVGDRLSRPLEKVIDDVQEAEIARLGTEAAEAIKATEELRAANLELEKLIQPRSLGRDRRESLTTKAAAFRGQAVVIVFESKDLEGTRLAEQVATALKGAGWTLSIDQQNIRSTAPIGAVVASTADIRSTEARDLLVAELKGAGIEVDAQVLQDSNPTVLFDPGLKPLPRND